MTSNFYFFDQYSRASHIGGIHRTKRDLKDFNQALYDVKVALAVENDDHSDKIDTQIKKQTILHQLKKTILPEILTKELDTFLQIFNDKSPINSPSSIRSKSPEEEIINPISNLPKVSLPSLLIIQLHSTWTDLIKNTNYKYKIWRTKAGEESWRQYVQQKRLQQLNPVRQQDTVEDKPIIRRRKSSRLSISSITNLSHRPSITINPKARLSRTFSRASIFSTSSMSQDNLRLLKSMHQGTTETIPEPIKNGIHVEFKLSTPNEQTEQKLVLFDVPKPDADLGEDIIAFAQNKCKRLLAETKQKILETTNDHNKKHQKICRTWFYEDNQCIRSRNNSISELNRRQKSKFALSILRHEIPEKYNIDISTPETKHKSYIELIDGSTQIYYPSGRLAVLRLRPPFLTTLFFDDTDSSINQFLGLVTSTGNVLLMQPTFHARFLTNNQYQNAYLCDGKTGLIEKEFRYNCQRQSITIDEDNINPSLQFQINSFMQLEYFNPSNILFAFKCQNEEFQFQLGIHLPTQSSVLMNLTTTILATKKISSNRSNSIISNDITNTFEKPKIQTRKLSEESNHSRPLPIMQELSLLKKRIKHICLNWLKECRTTLGIMDIDAYCLPDLPPQTILKQQIDDTNYQNKNDKQFTRRISVNDQLVKLTDRQKQLLTVKFESNIITKAIEQFVPHSDTGRKIKQQIYTKKILPAIK